MNSFKGVFEDFWWHVCDKILKVWKNFRCKQILILILTNSVIVHIIHTIHKSKTLQMKRCKTNQKGWRGKRGTKKEIKLSNERKLKHFI